MVHHAAQQRAVEARIGERQSFDVAFEEFDMGIFAAADRDQLGADVEPDADVACARKQRGERPRSAAEVGHPRAGLEVGQTHERVDDPLARLRREYVVIVRGGMTVEERDLFCLSCALSCTEAPVSTVP